MSNDVNSVVLIGRLVRDAELKRFSDGSPVANFALAVNHAVKENGEWRDKADFIDVAAPCKGIDGLAAFLTQGKRISVVGRIKQDIWTDAQTGERRSRLKVVAASIQLLDYASATMAQQ